jgi:enolase
MTNMISGGIHAGNQLDFQDFLVLPVGAASFRQAMEWIVATYFRLGRLLSEAGHDGALVGDEGGYGPRLGGNSLAVEFVLQAIESVGLEPGRDMALGIDVAASQSYRDSRYRLRTSGQDLDCDQFIDMLSNWVDRYPIISIEDPLADDDWAGWKRLSDRLADRVQLIGDDLFVTNRRRLSRGIEEGVANSVLIKLNQIGTLSETLETLRLALDNGYWPVVSARSGETEDATISDLVVATGAGQIKIGGVARSERLAKYNQLLRLEEELEGEAGYRGGSIFARLGRPAL